MIKPYLVTLMHKKQRTQLEIPAASSVDAVIFGIDLMHKLKIAGSVSSKPAERATA